MSYEINKPWLKATIKDIKNLINSQTFLVEDPKKGEPVTQCMDVYKAKTRSDRSLDNLKLIIVVRGDMQNKDLVWVTWLPTASMRNFKYLLLYATKHKARVHQLDFIGALLQETVKK